MAHVDRLIAMVGLRAFADDYPAQISSGIVDVPPFTPPWRLDRNFLLLDEPFLALDEPTRIDVYGDIHRMIRELQMSTILVRHDLGDQDR